MSETTRTLINAALDRYEVRESLGTGGMARVYKGYDQVLEREVAIKVLHEHLTEDPTFMERFKREARIVASFNHPNIVQVYDFDDIEHNGQHIFYMVMSYIPGTNLFNVLSEHAEDKTLMDDERIESIILDLLAALDYAHQAGMVHRDVKPANILINPEDHVVLTDFGIARLNQNSQLTEEGSTIGTPAYMSPEQAAGEPIDGRSDLYSAGIILFEMLTGETPYGDDRSLSVLLKHLHAPIPSLVDYPHIDNQYLDAVIFKALAKQPDQRYQTAGEFAADLRSAFAGQRTVAIRLPQKTEPLTPIATKPESTPNWTALAVLPVATLLLVIMALLLFDTGEAKPTPLKPTGIESMVGEPPQYFTSTFGDGDGYNVYWSQNDGGDLIREIRNGVYRIENRMDGQAVASVIEYGQRYQDVSIRAEARLHEDSSLNSGYGIVFRYVDQDHYNVFAVDGVGRYSVWVRNEGQWTELRDEDETWTRSEWINLRGEFNTLQVDIAGDRVLAYVNDVLVASVVDDTFAEGMLGVYVASPDDGQAIVEFDRYRIINNTDSFTESMTGGMENP